MCKVGIVNFANRKDNYFKMQNRLKYSLNKVGFNGELYMFNHETEIHNECPYHAAEDPAMRDRVVPYGFKPWAMQHAIDDGCDIILWMDAALYATMSISPIIDHIQDHGYLFFDNIGFTVGDYTSDTCLSYYGWTREKAFGQQMIMACFLGLDMRNEKAKEFFDGYFQAAKDKNPYRGSWNNINGEVSPDPRVRGHRHDQSCASIIISNMGLKITNAQSTYFAYVSHKGRLPISNTVCLWSEGI